MKVLLVIFALFFSMQSLAGRWVVKNMASQSLEPAIKVVKTFELNGAVYTVLENEFANFSSNEIPNLGGEKSFIDLPIQPAQPWSLDQANHFEGWHTEDLNYDDLPQREVTREIVVAVLDTGVDYTHEALSSNIWINSKEIEGNGIDDDGNGYIDDVRGWDFSDKDSDPIDLQSHGTHCAGVIAGLKDDQSSAQGIAQMVKVMPVKIFPYNGPGFMSDVAESIKYAVDNGAQVLSNSWSGVFTEDQLSSLDVLAEAIKYAEANSVIFVASAGNDGSNINKWTGKLKAPVGLKGHGNIVGVAAYDSNEARASFSNTGVENIHVAAPGVAIHSTVPGNKWESLDGTSMATPIVAGLIARGLSYGMSYEEAMDELFATSRTTSIEIKHGLIDPESYLRD